jgi:glycosyltransferase involved in cell wall biosynthesis
VSAQDPRELEISVVVPTYRRAGSVERLLASLTRQIEPPPFEVIVSIDGSEDGTRESVERFAGQLPVHALWQSHRGRAAACNAGARKARGRILVLLDDDMEPAPEFLREHARAHVGDARQALVGPAPIHSDASSRPIVRYRAASFAWKLERLRQSGSEPGIGEKYTGNFSVPRELFLEVGGFDEGFVCYGNEDKELLVRLRRTGVRFGFAARALATQHYEKEYADLARDTTSEGQSSVLFAERHPALLDDLHLIEFDRFRPRRRVLLAVGCWLARVSPGFLAVVAAFIRRAERRESSRLRAYYDFAFDLHYWLGVQRALRELPRGHRLSWSQWVRSLRERAAETSGPTACG